MRFGNAKKIIDTGVTVSCFLLFLVNLVLVDVYYKFNYSQSLYDSFLIGEERGGNSCLGYIYNNFLLKPKENEMLRSIYNNFLLRQTSKKSSNVIEFDQESKTKIEIRDEVKDVDYSVQVLGLEGQLRRISKNDFLKIKQSEEDKNKIKEAIKKASDPGICDLLKVSIQAGVLKDISEKEILIMGSENKEVKVFLDSETIFLRIYLDQNYELKLEELVSINDVPLQLGVVVPYYIAQEKPDKKVAQIVKYIVLIEE